MTFSSRTSDIVVVTAVYTDIPGARVLIADWDNVAESPPESIPGGVLSHNGIQSLSFEVKQLCGFSQDREPK